MSLRAYRTYQALVLGALGIFLLSKVMDGHITDYINQRFVLFLLLAAVGLILLAQLVLRERPLPESDQEPTAISIHKGWMLWLIALPLLLGLLTHEHRLNEFTLKNRGISTTAVLAVRDPSNLAMQIPSTQRSVLDWIRVYGPRGKPVEGEMADVTGFVSHDLRLGQDQFLLGRYSIVCCVADAAALGMIVEWDQAASLPEYGWLRVRGPVRAGQFDRKMVPVISAQQVEEVPEPQQPYLYP